MVTRTFLVGIEELDELVSYIAELLESHTIIIFKGDVGAGKTTLIKEICNKISVQDEVQSPTFSLVNEYLSIENSIVYHFDLYRLKDEIEVLDLGFDEYIYSGNLCLIEWPELIIDYLPEKFLEIAIENRNQFRNYTIVNHE